MLDYFTDTVARRLTASRPHHWELAEAEPNIMINEPSIISCDWATHSFQRVLGRWAVIVQRNMGAQS